MSLHRSPVYATKCLACQLNRGLPGLRAQLRGWQQFVLKPRGQQTKVAVLVGVNSSIKTLWRPTVVRSIYQQIIKDVKCSRVSLCLFFPFSLFKRSKPDGSPELCPEVMANIPKEVFTKEVSLKRQAKRNFLVRFILSVWEKMSFLMRLVRICITFGPLICLYPLACLSSSFRVRWWGWLLLAMEYTGPTFIKLGQWAGTRRDIFSAEFCDKCARLHDSTRQHAFYITKRKLRKAFGKKWRRIFEKIEKVPIGSGCIAQVHRAYMKAAMIPDESIIQEILSLEDSDEPEMDFAEGFEILGFRKINDYLEDREDKMAPTAETQHTASTTHPVTMTTETQEPEVQKEEESVIETGSGKILDPEKMTTLPPDSVEIVTQMEDDHLSPIQTDTETLIPVAVKVLHPGVYRQVQKDLAILRCGAALAQWFFPSLKWISVRESMEEFAQLMIRQIDLRFEAENMEKFVQNFEDNPYVRFPRPLRPYCKQSVLVETLEDGEPVNNFLQEELRSENDGSEMDSQTEIKRRIAAVGVEALLQMIFVDNLVHGDLHPGNILIQNAVETLASSEDKRILLVDVGDTVIVTTKPVDNPLRLVILDTGITSSLSDKDRENFRSVFTAVVMGEGEQVAELMLKHARYSECQDVMGFKRELATLVETFRVQSIKLGKVFSTCTRHKVKMESNFATIMMAIFVLEGLGRSLDPDLDILEKAKPLLLS